MVALAPLSVPSALRAQGTRAQSPQPNVTYYVLQSPSLAAAQTACQTYGFNMVSTIHAPDTYLVDFNSGFQLASIKQWVSGDPNVKNIDVNHQFAVPESAPTQLAAPTNPAIPLNTYITDGNLVHLFGSAVWAGYIQQPAFYSTNASEITPQLHPQQINGQGQLQINGNQAPPIVAVIDTGIDQLNTVLRPFVIPGYDFTRNVAGYASDVADLNQSTAAILEQSTVAILEQNQVALLNQSTVAILEQSTAAVLEGTGLPSHFGHGTMVAGLIHLVAPNAQLMPLKAFSADGTGSEANIIQAIYWATNHGANVINMSFELTDTSDALMKAVNYAARNGVILVASAGNNASTTLVYPASYGNVISVAAVNAQGQQSAFSNYGSDLVQIGAPGEGLVTTYPGQHYAQVWGTSFSAGLVSGAAAVMLQSTNGNTANQRQVGDIRRALTHAITCGTNGSLGSGCMD